MDLEKEIKKGRARYLETITYLAQERKIILEVVTILERPAKYAKVTFTKVDDFQQDWFDESPREEIYECFVAIEERNSDSEYRFYLIETDERELRFCSSDNPTITYY